jgi:TolB-like protein
MRGFTLRTELSKDVRHLQILAEEVREFRPVSTLPALSPAGLELVRDCAERLGVVWSGQDCNRRSAIPKYCILGGGRRMRYLSMFVVVIAATVSVLVSATGAAGETKIAIFRFESIGVDETTTRVATELLRGELSRLEMFEAISREEVCTTAEEASRLGRPLGAVKAVIGSLSGLGEKIVVRASLVDLNTEKVEFEDQIVSAKIDDLDVVMKRLALGLAKKKKHEETAEVEAIIEKETKEPRRRRTFFTRGGTVGYSFPTGNSYGDAGSMTTFEGLGWYETPDFTAQVVWGTSFSGDAADLYLDFGLLRLLSRADFAPYLGGSLGMHWISVDDGPVGPTSNDGLGISVEGGLVGFRTYDFRLIARAKYSVAFAEILDQSSQRGFTITFGLTHTSSTCLGGGCLPF